jgi:hypothetical protein
MTHKTTYNKAFNINNIYSIMKTIIETKLALIEDRFLLIDGMLLLSDEESIYELEYEYLRGQRDVLLELLSLYIE